MPNWKINKAKPGIKNSTQVTINFLSNATGNSNDEYNFPHKLLLINT